MPVSPRPGDVIRYAYLWTNERDANREEASKDRPSAVVLTVRDDAGDPSIFVVPIIPRRPERAKDGEELAAATRKRLNLQDAPCWVLVSDVNRFIWPGPDLRPVERPAGAFYRHGALPADQFRRIRDAVLQRARTHRLGVVPRSE